MCKQFKKWNIGVFVMLLMFSAIMISHGTFMNVSVAEAASKKASISAKKLVIPVGKQKQGDYWTDVKTWDRGTASKLTVKNKVKGATYTFTSSDKKIVTIDKDGGYPTGVKAGTATITCKETYKNKTTVVGTCKITVKKTVIKSYGETVYSDKLINPIVAVGSGEYDFYDYYYGEDYPFFYTGYRNPSSSYTFVSSSKDFTMKEIKSKATGGMEDFSSVKYIFGYQYTAKKAGVYTIKINETYNKKTTEIGSFKIEVKDTHVTDNVIDLRVGELSDPGSYIYYKKPDTMYYFKVKDYDNTNPEGNVVGVTIDNDSEYKYSYLLGQVPGNAEVTIHEGSEDGTLIGTLKYKVFLLPCEDINVDDEYTAYVDDYFYIHVDTEPYDTTDKVSIVSDNPNVLKVEYDDYSGWSYAPLKAGTAKLTIKCGDITKECKVIVKK